MGNFYTDTIRRSSAFLSTARCHDLALLEPTTRAAVRAIIADAAGLGIRLMVFETFRSRQRQQFLFDQHSTELRTVGVHHYGLACDLVKQELDGSPSWEGDFTFILPLAKKHGLISGIDWGRPTVKPSFVDADHLQRIRVEDQSKLFNESWYPEADYSPWVSGTVAT